MKNKKINIGIGILILLVLSSVFVSAFSISMPYMENKQLIIGPGQTKNLEFVLQNGGGATEDIKVRAAVLEGQNITQITDLNKIYTVSPGEMIKVNVRVSAPENASIGDSANITLGFNTVTESETGQFTFGSSIDQKFSLVVGKVIAEEEGGLTWVFYLVIVIIVIAIAFFTIRNRKKDK